MNRFLRFLTCLASSFVAVWISGYGNLMNAISESLAITAFLGAVFVLGLLFFLLWEVRLGYKKEIKRLSSRIEALEESLKDKE